MPDQTSTSHRVLDAAMAVASQKGLGGLTLDDVAAHAGVSRQTVYRHFGRRDVLIAEVIHREETSLLHHVRLATKDASSLVEAIERALLTLFADARTHPLLDRLLSEEPGAILPHLLPTDTPVLGSALQAVRELMVRFSPQLAVGHRERLAEMITRLALSYVVAPPEGDFDIVAHEFAVMVDYGVRRPPNPSAGAGPDPGEVSG